MAVCLFFIIIIYGFNIITKLLDLCISMENIKK